MGQFRALASKNWIIYKRSIVGSILQIVIPVAFMLFTLLTRHLAKIETYQETSNLSNNSLTFNLFGDPVAASGIGINSATILKQCPTGWVVALVPTGNPMVTQLSSMLQSLTYTVRTYSNDAQVDAIVRDVGYGTDYPYFCFGITVQNQGHDYKYYLRFNSSNNQAPSSLSPLTIDKQFDVNNYYSPLGSGVNSITTIMNNLIMQAQTSTTDMFVNRMGIIYTEQFSYDPIYLYFGNSFEFINLFPLLILYLRLTSAMLEEKEKKIRQSMSITGMKLYIYYGTWFIRYFIIFAIIHAANSAILCYAFPNLPYYIPITLYLLFDTVLILQSFFIQIFVTRAKIGIIFALVFFVVQYAINYTISNNTDVTQQIYRYVSIVPHVAYALVFKNLIYSASLNWSVSFLTVLNKYTVLTAIISFLGNIGFWLLALWYLDQVFPNQWGAKRHICFCFEPCCKKEKHQEFQVLNNQNSSINIRNNIDQTSKNSKRILPLTEHPSKSDQIINEEQDSFHAQIQPVEQKYKQMQNNDKAIIIRNLNKVFDENEVVKNLNATIYTDQIFVLLGHNGAGKTTTISMITGMIEPTSGYIEVLGMTDLSDIRSKLGVCPQHDTLYDELTVEEHLRLFATFRGLEGNELQLQVNKLIKDVNLEEKRKQYAKNLSGGQKRRLSVAIAFSGGAKVIILDEPTSGMDTSARRYIWQMLKNYKSGRIIILTTHFMDEADYLGDRIAIMARGKLMALGSNIFLKNKFGAGYNIIFVKKNNMIKTQPILQCMKKHIPNAKILTDVSSEFSMQLPLDQVKKFGPLFTQIDSRKQQLNIQSYGISITTLEQVFLKVGQSSDQKQSKENQNISLPMQSKQLQMSQSDLQSPTKKRKKQILIGYQNQSSKLQIENKQQEILENTNWVREDGMCERFFSHLLATILKRLRVIRRDLKSFIFQIILPMAIVVLAMMLMRISFIKDVQSSDLNYNIYLPQFNNVVPVFMGANTPDSTLLTSLAGEITAKYGSKYSVTTNLASSDILFDQLYLFPQKMKEKKLPGGIYISSTYTNTGINMIPFTTIMNTKTPTSCIAVQTLAAETYINHLSANTVSITPVSKPLPMTQRQLQVNNAISGFFAALIFSIALAFKFASIVAFIVKQRQDKSKHQQIVSGLNLGSYWIGNYLYDFLLYSIVAIFSLVICKVLQIKSLIDNDAFTATCLIFGLFGFSNISLTYIMSNIFKDYGNAQGVVYFFNFVSGGIAPIIILVLRWIGTDSNKIGRGIAWALRLVPSFAFGEGLLNIASIQLLSLTENKGVNYKALDLQVSLAGILYLGIGGCILLILIFVIQHVQSNEKIMRQLSSQSDYTTTNQIQQSDVLEQQKKAIQANPQDYQILTKKLRKVYLLDSDKKYKVAVDNLSFGVQKGEVFGLLGVNGAGKSTTFKMLAGEIVSTDGESYFMGMKISQNLSEIRKNLGYCPQFDALIQNLTVREQLQLFYDMKCLPRKLKKIAIDHKIKQLNLTQHQNKLSGTLSGGNKRKLSVAMAMIGNPNILFLDEPSTGMDPKARRFMWKVISRISTQKKLCTVILTTHSMQQAEALSTRLAIMVNGNFKCIGTPQHIKSKYGKGLQIQIKLKPILMQQTLKIANSYKLENVKVSINNYRQVMMKLKTNQSTIAQIAKNKKGSHIWTQLQIYKSQISINVLIQFILLQQRIYKIFDIFKQLNNQIQIIQNFESYVRYKTNNKISKGKLFELLEQRKQQLKINHYSIKQATVQQIFNNFADENENVEQQK